MAESDKHTGTVKWYKAEKNYGFIVPDNGSPDVFVHRSAIVKAGLFLLRTGDRVKFRLTNPRSGSRVVAIDIELVSSVKNCRGNGGISKSQVSSDNSGGSSGGGAKFSSRGGTRGGCGGGDRTGGVGLHRTSRAIGSVKVEKDTKKIEEVEDCFVLNFDPFEPASFEKLSLGNESRLVDDNEISVVAEKGPVACRDYPHPRHLCAKFPFKETPHSTYCNMCFCYVCDIAAPCEEWDSHKDASEDHGTWKRIKELRKHSVEVACRDNPHPRHNSNNSNIPSASRASAYAGSERGAMDAALPHQGATLNRGCVQGPPTNLHPRHNSNNNIPSASRASAYAGSERGAMDAALPHQGATLNRGCVQGPPTDLHPRHNSNNNIPSTSRAPAYAGSGRGGMDAALPLQGATLNRGCVRGPPTNPHPRHNNIPSASRAPAYAGSERSGMDAALPLQDATLNRECVRGPPTNPHPRHNSNNNNMPSASRAPAHAGSGRGGMDAALPRQGATLNRSCVRGSPTSPHPRHLCAIHPFMETHHSIYCSMCFCYVCDTAAPCAEWDRHQNAFNDQGIWTRTRAIRQSTLISRTFTRIPTSPIESRLLCPVCSIL